ncbi:hypothetical protein SUGI_0324990 [Cryptomeria japonica]|uniref:eukaryotic translation initiation factor 5B n=1 Tax=Cryptomeria japonica TaxID=3369 RepID=UPI002408CE74|nr:eukaryotic translation initiation factor 5B [Cryptomeria japonica]GLJ18361.1 hypothetical protein SUGI_0324990 [Cryptomeria japonica]
MGRKKAGVSAGDDAPAAQSGKSKKKNLIVDDDEYAIVDPVADNNADAALEDEVSALLIGKKKAKGKKSAIEQQEREFEEIKESLPEEEETIISFSGKKKGKKGSQKKFEEDREPSFVNVKEEDDNDDDGTIVFSGKKKAKGKKNASFTTSMLNAGILDEEDGEGDNSVDNFTLEEKHEDSEVDDVIQFTGKKKGKAGKKTEKIVEGNANANANDDAVVIDEGQKQEGPASVQEPLPSTGSAVSKKQKQKKKKSGRTAEEEEDLDKILAELDLGTEKSKSAGADEVPKSETIESEPAKEEVVPDEVSAEPEGPGESAAAKKKKKKKEKEKEKKAAVAAAEEKGEAETKEEKSKEVKGKIPDKKVPKHVREMQERLARLKEEEERRKREEEEKRRKEEEEQRRLEELERQKEEAKRRKKEREKEKLQKKKAEGKLLTGKQKEEARRLALMREQFLAQSGGLSDLSKEEQTASAPKKPKYETKKKKRGPTTADSAASQQAMLTEDHDIQDEAPQEAYDKVKEEASAMIIEPVENEVHMDVEQEKMETEEEEEDDWDAKSWDDKDVALQVKSAFAEEEESSISNKIIKSSAGPASKSVVKNTAAASVPKSAPMSSVAKTAPPVKPSLPVKQVEQVQPESEEDSESEETESEDENMEDNKRQAASRKREERKAEALLKRNADDLRSPICCILGHVDTGKTKLLDCIRRTNVQEGEAGGITQQIGATYFPMENIRERTKELKADANLRVPGLLVIDTPGHESFTNLRARGSSLCDIAILVVDIMHGLEPQTLESLNLLKMRHTPFIVALNKVDRLYGWKARPNAPIRMTFKQQSKDVQNEFEHRLTQVITELKEQGLNSELYFRNKEVKKYVSIVPTSAISGEGVPDLLMLLVQLTQKMMEERLMYISEVQCTVLEVKVIEGLGTTIDVILINGVLHEGDQIVVCGMQGPIVTTIRALLTPHPMKELRVKGSYQHHKELKAAQGIKITAQGLEHAIAGTQLYVVGPDDDLDDVKEEAMQDISNVMSRIDKSGEGVYVQASTLGSLEALLEFLKTPAVSIPVSAIGIGPVHKKDVMRASVMLEKKKKEYAAILAFDVKITPEARELADEVGVKIFAADIIYHLFDQFKAYMDNLKEERKKEAAEDAVFPCVLGILPNCIFNKKDPIVVGVDILEGIARIGTPLCVPTKDFIDIGKIASIEINHKAVDMAKKGEKVAMKIVGSNADEAQKMFGRHFEMEDEFVSHLTRRSIDILKENYRDDLSNDDWKLVVKLKKLLKIP